MLNEEFEVRSPNHPSIFRAVEHQPPSKRIAYYVKDFLTFYKTYSLETDTF